MRAKIEDPRKRADGGPLRISEEIMYLQMQDRPATSAKTLSEYIYESQLSVMVTGIDDWVWAAYCFVDVYFKGDEHCERVEHYSSANPKMDPHSCGRYAAEPPVWTPREYFLRALSSRMQQIKQEWENSVSRLIQQIEPYVCISTSRQCAKYLCITRYTRSLEKTQTSERLESSTSHNKRGSNGPSGFYASSRTYSPK
jgi:hypothetical protein